MEGRRQVAGEIKSLVNVRVLRLEGGRVLHEVLLMPNVIEGEGRILNYCCAEG